jgi:hypothetical protein
MTVQIEVVPSFGPILILTYQWNDGLCETCGQDHSSSMKAVAVSKKRLKPKSTEHLSLADLFWGGEE